MAEAGSRSRPAKQPNLHRDSHWLPQRRAHLGNTCLIGRPGTCYRAEGACTPHGRTRCPLPGALPLESLRERAELIALRLSTNSARSRKLSSIRNAPVKNNVSGHLACSRPPPGTRVPARPLRELLPRSAHRCWGPSEPRYKHNNAGRDIAQPASFYFSFVPAQSRHPTRRASNVFTPRRTVKEPPQRWTPSSRQRSLLRRRDAVPRLASAVPRDTWSPRLGISII